MPPPRVCRRVWVPASRTWDEAVAVTGAPFPIPQRLPAIPVVRMALMGPRVPPILTHPHTSNMQGRHCLLRTTHHPHPLRNKARARPTFPCISHPPDITDMCGQAGRPTPTLRSRSFLPLPVESRAQQAHPPGVRPWSCRFLRPASPPNPKSGFTTLILSSW